MSFWDNLPQTNNPPASKPVSNAGGGFWDNLPSTTTEPATPSLGASYKPFTGKGYFPSTDLGNNSSTDVSGRPFQGYTMKIPASALNPGVNVPLVDKTRVAAGFDPTKPMSSQIPKSVLENPRMSEALSSAIKKAMNGNGTDELDHIMALGLSGSNDISNLQIQPGLKGGVAATSDKLETSLISKVKNGDMTLYDAQNELAKSKGKTLPENSGQRSAVDQWLMDNPDVLNSLANLQNTITDIPKNIWGNLGNIGKDLISPFTGAYEGLKTAAVGAVNAFTSKGRSTSEKVGATGNLLAASANAVFSPISAVFNALKDVPIVGSVSQIATLPFSIAGTGGEIAGKEIIDALPISAQDKNNLRDVAGQLGALAGQIALGYGIEKVTAAGVVKDTAIETADRMAKGEDMTPAKTQDILKTNIEKAKAETPPTTIKPNASETPLAGAKLNTESSNLPEPPAKTSGVTLQGSLVPGADAVSKFITKDIVEPLQGADVKGFISRIKTGIEHFFDSSLGEPNIREKAAAITARAKQEAAQIKDASWKVAENQRNWFSKIDDNTNINFMDAIEKGAVDDFTKGMSADVGSAYKGMAQDFRTRLNAVYTKEQNAGLFTGYVEDYFPHIWKDDAKATAWIDQYEKSLGRDKFLKTRFWDLIQEGRKAGLELKSTNPEEIVLNREWSATNAISKINALDRMEQYGMASDKPVRGWPSYTDPRGKMWSVHPEAADVLNKAFLAKSLWTSKGIGGYVFRGIMAAKNSTVAIKLGLSLFHFVHEATIRPAAETAFALQKFLLGDENAADAIKDIGKTMTFSDQPSAVKFGMDVKKAWGTPFDKLDPEMQTNVSLISRGGGSPAMSEEFIIRAKDGYKKAIQDENFIGAGIRLVPKIFEAIQKPLFDYYVPSLKIDTFLSRAKDFIEKNPNADELTTDVALRRMWQETDAQYGQMIYSTLFWNKMVKESAEASFLSMGWQLGFLRTFGGAAIDAATIVKRIADGTFAKSDISYRLLYATTYTLYASIVGGMMTTAFTGKQPTSYKDYFFPRTGGMNPDGTPERRTTPFFTREPASYLNQWQKSGLIGGTAQLAIDKANPVLSAIGDLAQNKDYYGYEIIDPNDPLIKQTQEFLKFSLESLAPISIGSAQRSQTLKGKMLSFAGFSLAPKYISESTLQSKIFNLYDKRFGGTTKSLASQVVANAKSEIRRLYDSGQTTQANQKLNDAINKGYFTTKASLTKFINDSDIPADVRAFRGLPAADQQELLKDMSLQDLERYAWSATSATRQSLSSLSRVAREFVDGVNAGKYKQPKWKQGKLSQ